MKCLVLCGMILMVMHPFHLSVTEIFHNPDDQRLEISMKLFVDDMEEALQLAGYGKLRLGTEEEEEKAQVFLYDYLLKNLDIQLDGKKIECSFVGKEYEPGNVMWCYLQINDIPDFSSIYIRNHVLTEVFDDQQNIVHVKRSGKMKSLRLRKGKDKGELVFE